MKLSRLFPDVIKWDVLFYMSIATFILIIITLFINPMVSTLLTFAILCMWSRIPCHIGYHTKDMEMIDFFSLVVGVNLGPLAGAGFAFGMMWITSLFGKIEPPAHTFISSFGLVCGALAGPFLYTYFGGNLLLAMYGFTVVRYITAYAVVFSVTPAIAMEEVTAFIPCIVTAYITNTIYVKFFGDYFGTKLMAQAMQVDWQLFLLMGLILGVISLIKFKEQFAEKMKTDLVMRESDVKEERPSWQDYA